MRFSAIRPRFVQEDFAVERLDPNRAVLPEIRGRVLSPIRLFESLTQVRKLIEYTSDYADL